VDLPPRAQAFVCVAQHPGVCPRDIGTTLGITERSVLGIVTGLTAAGYVVNDKETADRSHQHQVHRPGSPATVRPMPDAVRVCPDHRVLLAGGFRKLAALPAACRWPQGHLPGLSGDGQFACR